MNFMLVCIVYELVDDKSHYFELVISLCSLNF